jgi:hypothetical protein
MCGTSQPDIHNVLKNIQTLSTASADRLMQALQLSVPELLWRCPSEKDIGVQAVPVLRNRIGPGTDANLTIFGGYIPFPATLVADLIQPVAARLGPDLVLPRSVAPNDLVLLDQNPRRRESPSGMSCWVVVETAGLRVRYVKLGGADVYVANEANLREPEQWESIPSHTGSILDIVRARIVWIGRQMETSPPGSPDTPRGGD